MIKEITAQDLLKQIEMLTSQAKGNVGAATESTSASNFGDLLRQTVSQVNETQLQASELAKSFELGAANVSLEEVMIARQKAALSFQSVLQVRNKLIEAYKEIMAMQV